MVLKCFNPNPRSRPTSLWEPVHRPMSRAIFAVKIAFSFISTGCIKHYTYFNRILLLWKKGLSQKGFLQNNLFAVKLVLIDTLRFAMVLITSQHRVWLICHIFIASFLVNGRYTQDRHIIAVVVQLITQGILLCSFIRYTEHFLKVVLSLSRFVCFLSTILYVARISCALSPTVVMRIVVLRKRKNKPECSDWQRTQMDQHDKTFGLGIWATKYNKTFWLVKS